MVFADKAKSMLVPLLGYPSTSTVQSIIFLTWHDFGLNSEGGLWGFTGMALRMAQDLGLHLVWGLKPNRLNRWLMSWLRIGH